MRNTEHLTQDINSNTLKVLSDTLVIVPKRDYPWRNTNNPYHILVAELLLQRTLPHHVLAIYEKIIHCYPDPCSLAAINQEDLSLLLAPLGLKKRVDLMMNAARYICQQLNNQIPCNYRDLLKIPAIGPYTAASVMSLVHGEAIAMVDVNTARIVSRTLSVIPKAESPQKDKAIIAIADAIVACNPQKVREVNLGFLDVGSLFCRSKPRCLTCPLQKLCVYYEQLTS